jgi:hypothetical protein
MGMIINLLLVALVSYYFKRKYDHLEKSINEHSDHIYLLLKKERDTLRSLENKQCFDLSQYHTEQKKYPSVSSSNDNSSENDSDDNSSDDDSDTNSEYSEESINNTQVDEIIELDDRENTEETNETEDILSNVSHQLNITVEEVNNNTVQDEKEGVKQLVIQEMKPDDTTIFNIQKVDVLPQDYNKLTMKQLKDLLSNKGITVKPHMKKNDLIDLASKNSLEIDLGDDAHQSLSKNPSHISITDCDLDLTNLNDVVTPLNETVI